MTKVFFKMMLTPWWNGLIIGSWEFLPNKCVTVSINSKEGDKITYRMKEVEYKHMQICDKYIQVTIVPQLKFESHICEKKQESHQYEGVHLDESMSLSTLQGSNSHAYGIWKLNMVSQQDKRCDNHR